MKNPELFQKTKSILEEAQKSNSLHFGLTESCALGIILKAQAIGDEQMLNFVKYWGFMLRETNPDGKTQLKNPFPFLSKEELDEITTNVNLMISKSGYTIDELERIEHAYENVNLERSPEDSHPKLISRALDAVIKELELIHSN